MNRISIYLATVLACIQLPVHPQYLRGQIEKTSPPIMVVRIPETDPLSIGVLGAQLVGSKIIQVYPASDLNRVGVIPGDVLLSIDGEDPSMGRSWDQITPGFAGSVMELQVIHQGQINSFSVVRREARYFANCGNYPDCVNPGYYRRWAFNNVKP